MSTPKFNNAQDDEWQSLKISSGHMYQIDIPSSFIEHKAVSLGLYRLTRHEGGYLRYIYVNPKTVTILRNDDRVGGWIGSIGGLIGLMLTMFTVLFGTKILAPFGIVQKFCCFSRTKGKFVRLPIIPLVKSTQREKVRIEDQVKYLTYRLHALETILSDYVISSDMIQALTVDAKKMEEPKPYNHVTEENQINLLVN
ncbi:583_t:CDS:2 [Entrophospora sp. SA101]|nr:583_t:CDS:2 [Entrophospora sp. SA101]